MNNSRNSQIYTPAVSPNEINVTEILGIHVIPTIENNWLNIIGHKAFVGWLQLLALILHQENLAKENDALVQYPTKKELLKILKMSENTFNRTIMGPLFNVGLLDVVEVEVEGSPWKKGIPTSRIIVFRYPFNKRENLYKPLQVVRDFKTDYTSKAKSLGVLGLQKKIEKANEEAYLKMLEDVAPAENQNQFVQDNIENMNIEDEGLFVLKEGEQEVVYSAVKIDEPNNSISSNLHSIPGNKNNYIPSYSQAVKTDSYQNPVDNPAVKIDSYQKNKAVKTDSYENPVDNSAVKIDSYEQENHEQILKVSQDKTSSHLSTGEEETQLSKLTAFNIYNNTNSLNSFSLLKREINNIYIYKGEEKFSIDIREIKTEMNPKLFLVLKHLIDFKLSVQVIIKILDILDSYAPKYSEIDLSDAAFNQILYMQKVIANGNDIDDFFALFKKGIVGKIAAKQFDTGLRQANVRPKVEVAATTTSNSVGFYNWLDERD